MKTKKNNLILKKSDYDLLLKYIYSRLSPLSGDYKNAAQLYEELKTAEIHANEATFPGDLVCINSTVEVEEEKTKRRMRFRIVMPDQGNMTKQKLSVFAPLSIALMGYRKGQRITWNMPAGDKIFYIRNVNNG